MKKEFLIFLLSFLSLMAFSGCSSLTYYAEGKSGMPCPDIPVIEPYTDIGIFKTHYTEREHSDSLTALAHEAMMEVLGENDSWNLGDVMILSDASEYEAIRKDIFALLESCQGNYDIPETSLLPADKQRLASATLPASLLDFMNREGKPYMMILLHNGFEPHPDTPYRNRYTGNKWAQESNGNITELECVVADAKQNRVYFYNRSCGYGSDKDDKPTSKAVIEKQLHSLLSDYPHKNTITKTELPKLFFHYGVGYGQIFPSQKITEGRPVGPDNTVTGLEFLWRISKTPLYLGLTATSNFHKIASTTEANSPWERNQVDYSGPMIGMCKIVGKHHFFDGELSVGAVAVGGKTEGFDLGAVRTMGESVSLCYSYRITNSIALGIQGRAYTFNNPVQSDGKKRFIDLWNVALCFTTLSF